MYTVITIIFATIVFAQLWYIIRLRNALKYICQEVVRLQHIITHYDTLIKADEERFGNGSEKS